MPGVHCASQSMRGTATMESSVERFPSGTVLEVVDDAPAQVRRQSP